MVPAGLRDPFNQRKRQPSWNMREVVEHRCERRRETADELDGITDEGAIGVWAIEWVLEQDTTREIQRIGDDQRVPETTSQSGCDPGTDLRGTKVLEESVHADLDTHSAHRFQGDMRRPAPRSAERQASAGARDGVKGKGAISLRALRCMR